ncbi:MAG: type IV secretion system DNA-binding domain-containing protein [Parcubacteria group bacterium]|nr:type IV secretion system DNA-binding domain-containing protein [Parcubacteria group bacterium]
MSDITYFAKTNFRGQDRIFGIKEKDRLQHMYIIGQTGTGKTTLLKNLAVQDIKTGQGLAVIDPHGEFVDELLSLVPLERVSDVVYFNPVDAEYPIGFNILEVKNPENKHLVASGLMAIFTKIWAGVWSARMEYILNNCVLALLDTPETTLMGIPRLLVDKEYRKKIISNIKDPTVRAFWTAEYEVWQERFRNEAIVPIQNKVGQFLATRMIRNIVGQPKSTLDIEKIIEERKILLVNVSKGLIGEDNSALLGAMLITKIQLTAMERIRIKEVEKRHPFFLHIDEFQNFATDAFATILSEARKYGLALIISHQYIGQLVTETSTRVRDAIFGNAGTLLSFRVGAIDAEFLESQFAPEIMAIDLVNLPNYNIYLKLLVDGISSRPFSATTLPPIPLEKDSAIREKIIEASRMKFGAPREIVEKMIEKWSAPLVNSEQGRSGQAPRKKTIGPKVLMPKEKEVSLEELTKREPENFKRKIIEPDLAGVRKALEEIKKG